jgi:protein-disulfide isomerase
VNAARQRNAPVDSVTMCGMVRHNLPVKAFGVVLAASVALMAGSTANTKGNTYGNPRAPILLEVFSDFQCPGCKGFHDKVFQQILNEYVKPGKVFVIYRYYPLAMHPYGRACAEFACAAARVNKYHDVAEALFAQQAAIAANGNVEETANQVLTPTEAKTVKGLISSPEVQQEILGDMDEGKLVPVASTPTLWVTPKGKSSQAIRWPIDYSLLKSYFDGLLAN